jgi:hypothetical protein
MILHQVTDSEADIQLRVIHDSFDTTLVRGARNLLKGTPATPIPEKG